MNTQSCRIYRIIHRRHHYSMRRGYSLQTERNAKKGTDLKCGDFSQEDLKGVEGWSTLTDASVRHNKKNEVEEGTPDTPKWHTHDRSLDRRKRCTRIAFRLAGACGMDPRISWCRCRPTSAVIARERCPRRTDTAERIRDQHVCGELFFHTKVALLVERSPWGAPLAASAPVFVGVFPRGTRALPSLKDYYRDRSPTGLSSHLSPCVPGFSPTLRRR